MHLATNWLISGGYQRGGDQSRQDPSIGEVDRGTVGGVYESGRFSIRATCIHCRNAREKLWENGGRVKKEGRGE